MEIVSGIHLVEDASANLAHSNVYLTINGGDLAVIDTGTSGNANHTIDYIQKIGHQPSDVSTIIVTHFHMDHTGSLKQLQELTGAKVAAHEADVPYITGAKPYPVPKSLLVKAAAPFMKPAPVPVDIFFKEDNHINGLTVIHTPGHTPGSICLLDETKGVLFAGDALRFDGANLSESPEGFAFDVKQAKMSIRKIACLNFDVMLCGHGEPLKGNASQKVKAFAETLK
jgi:glyoxylase-like metal-dependent hydrolase (beta-lactamase superfamily II)